MKKLAIATGLILATVAASASAQVYWSRTYNAPYGASSNQECWNPRAGHFEQVRPGEYQGDLDFGRCRLIGGAYYDRYYDNSRYADRPVYRGREECWNPRAGPTEEVRRGDVQNDLDFSRCRVYR
jgi:hypothetical protein